MAFLDYEKVFDSVETWAALDPMQKCHIYWRYLEVLRCMNYVVTLKDKVTDIGYRISKLKWEWAGYLYRRTDGRWSKRVLDWRQRVG